MGRTVRLCLFTVTSATDGILFRDGPTAGTDAVRYVQFSHRVEISGGARLAASSRSLATPLHVVFSAAKDTRRRRRVSSETCARAFEMFTTRLVPNVAIQVLDDLIFLMTTPCKDCRS